jgi:hypothetical protein
MVLSICRQMVMAAAANHDSHEKVFPNRRVRV